MTGPELAHEISRAEALFALATAPFVVVLLVAVTVMACAALWRTPGHSDYVGIVRRGRGDNQ